jgi:hypothetical protein
MLLFFQLQLCLFFSYIYFGYTSTIFIPASSSNVTVQGRTIINGNARLFDWELTTFEIGVQDTTLVTANFTLHQYSSASFHILVDGIVNTPYNQPIYVNQSGMYTLVENLDSSTTHRITVINTAEPFKTATWNGPLALEGFYIDGEIIPLTPRNRKLVFLGDSITASSGSIGVAPCVEALNTTNGVTGYGARLARGFNADVEIIAASGRGMYQVSC